MTPVTRLVSSIWDLMESMTPSKLDGSVNHVTLPSRISSSFHGIWNLVMLKSNNSSIARSFNFYIPNRTLETDQSRISSWKSDQTGTSEPVSEPVTHVKGDRGQRTEWDLFWYSCTASVGVISGCYSTVLRPDLSPSGRDIYLAYTLNGVLVTCDSFKKLVFSCKVRVYLSLVTRSKSPFSRAKFGSQYNVIMPSLRVWK